MPRGSPSSVNGMLPYRFLTEARSFGNVLKPRYIFGAAPLDQ